MNLANAIKIDVRIPQKSDPSYPIIINYNLLNFVPEIIGKYVNKNKLLLVSNEKVFFLYGQKLVKNFIDNNFNIQTVILPDGEDFKNLDSFKGIIDSALDFNLGRNDAMIALGGGVIGDMTGYAAASFLRGIDFIQIPTTLLSQVDASVGGKVGINHIKGKNLIGAFYQPKCVLIDPSTLTTLDNKNLKSGFGEVLKYAFIEKLCGLELYKTSFFDFLEINSTLINQLDKQIIAEMIKYCCLLKASVVQQDEKEIGLRAILNLGHTIGHALEVCGKYIQLAHGEAVSIGMVAAFNLSRNLRFINECICDRAINLVKIYDLPYKIPQNILIKDILESMKLDKKRVNNKTRFILPVNDIGNVNIYDNISNEDVTKVLELMY